VGVGVEREREGGGGEEGEEGEVWECECGIPSVSGAQVVGLLDCQDFPCKTAAIPLRR